MAGLELSIVFRFQPLGLGQVGAYHTPGHARPGMTRLSRISGSVISNVLLARHGQAPIHMQPSCLLCLVFLVRRA